MENQNYRIGLTTQITGIRPETLRAWERRYAVVRPIRSNAGDRLYSQSDLDRLVLIKKLCDSGDAISTIANLSEEDLRARLEQYRAKSSDESVNKLNFILVGSSILDKATLDNMKLQMLDVQLDANKLKSNYHKKVDFVIVEVNTVHQGTLDYILNIKKQVKAQKVLCAYHFGRDADIKKLSTLDSSTITLPLAKDHVIKWCKENFGEYQVGGRKFKERQLSDAQLKTIIESDVAIKCECPKHLGEIIKKIIAFEQYCAECEVRNDQDADVHAYLAEETSQARHEIETALITLAKIENISY
ncbi:MAG: MerR family transcriptional regulator [Pseudomonadota bacterium]|nr:MerR family transcriptional regulator [Pseudomonadota bacterium]|tara:strand:- start:4859 stop:5761 length:903 start_codon:yes stop_codon:yes gene_type:complete